MTPEAAELALPCGMKLRGNAWATGDCWMLLLHEPGANRDIDDLTPLIGAAVRSGASAVAFDLPGHGLSDGVWDDNSDIRAFIEYALDWIDAREPTKVAILAIGPLCYPALQITRDRRIDIAVLLSPIPDPTVRANPKDFRGDGASKLVIYGGANEAFQDAATEIRRRSIGWAVTLSVGTQAQATDLITSPLGTRVQEGIELFLREQWLLGRRRGAFFRKVVQEEAS